MPVSWTPSLRADLSPTAPSESAIVPDAAWSKVKTSISQTSFRNGLNNPGAAKDALTRGLDLLAERKFPESASVEALGAVMAILASSNMANRMAAIIAKTRDAVVLAESLVVAHSFASASAYPNAWIAAIESKVPMGYASLRDLALRGNEKKIRRIAEREWPHAPLTLKITFVHALPSARDLAAELATAIAALPKGQRMIIAPILATLHDPTHFAAVLAHRSGAHPLVDAIENLGDAALDGFVAAWDLSIGDRPHLARATSAYTDDRAAAIMLSELDKISTGDIAREYFIRHPSVADRALADKAKMRSGTLASEILASAKRTTVSHDEIPIEELPMVLSDPPWLSKTKNRKPIVVQVKPLARAESINVSPQHHAAMEKQVAFSQFPIASGEELETFVNGVKKGDLVISWWRDHFRIPHDVVRSLIMSEGLSARTPGYFTFAAAVLFGGETIVPVMDHIEKNWQSVVGPFLTSDPHAFKETALEIDSHRLAALLVQTLVERRNTPLAWRYFEAHVEASIAGVIPIAVGRAGKIRTAAEGVLRRIAARHVDQVRAIAKSYGEEVARSVEEILAFDARFDCPQRPPKMPAEWQAKTFTRPITKDGRALPLEAVERIGHMLAFSDSEFPYAGLADVREFCDARSLAELSWDAARAWERGRARTAARFMIESLALFGDDEVIRRTTPAIKNHAIVAVLGQAATDAAATELCTIAWRIKTAKTAGARHQHWGTRATVMAAFKELARRRGVTVDQVEDALAPTIGLNEPRVSLDYGSRTIDVGFDERLDPFIESARGKLRKLPKAGKKDDPAKVARAAQMWDELFEDVTAIADLRLDSLERAMIANRTWTLDAFRKAWMDHALMRHLSRGIVWRGAEKSFRVAEDGSFADASDAVFDVGAALISVAHPAEMSDLELETWRRVFFDYKIAQPIEQLSRRVDTKHVTGNSLALVVETPFSQMQLTEKMRSAGFESAWRNREMIHSRPSFRSGMIRVRLGPVVENKNITGFTLSAEEEAAEVSLSRLHRVDVAEIFHAFLLRPA